MSVVYRAFEKPRDFSGSPPMSFSLVIEWVLHPLLGHTVRSPGVFVAPIRVVLPLWPHLLVISLIAERERAMSNPLRICGNAGCARVPVDNILSLGKHLLQFIRQNEVDVVVFAKLLIGHHVLVPVLALFFLWP